MLVTVETLKLSRGPDGNPFAEDCESTKVINWTNSSDRKWFMNHMTWAVNNDRKLEIYPEDMLNSESN